MSSKLCQQVLKEVLVETKQSKGATPVFYPIPALLTSAFIDNPIKKTFGGGAQIESLCL
jgi:hypothetical protein